MSDDHTCDGGQLHLPKPNRGSPYRDLQSSPVPYDLWAASVPCPHCDPDGARGALATNTSEAVRFYQMITKARQVVEGAGATQVTTPDVRLRMIANALGADYSPTVSLHERVTATDQEGDDGN